MESMLSTLESSLKKDLNREQQEAYELLLGRQNLFLTGAAGTGKSYLIRSFLREKDPKKFPILASTGAAAVLVGGRTFHSFFGLGIMEGGPQATVERALKDRRVIRRLNRAEGFVLDEVSMIPGIVLACAERIACLARESTKPWGGLKVIAVGDFAQLPPVNPHSREKDWAFRNPTWERSEFRPLQLMEMMRSGEDPHFCGILSQIRLGQLSDEGRDLLEQRRRALNDEEAFEGTKLFPRKVDVRRINRQHLYELEGESHFFDTEYKGSERFQQILKRQSPVEEKLELRENALVMIRQNDPKGRWVNGSLGHVKNFIDEDVIEVELMNGRLAAIEKSSFSLLDAEGREAASAKNFPLILAYALTIHKAQGVTLDRMRLSIENLWEPGQAYVALSRVKSSRGLFLESWDEDSIFSDPEVLNFQRQFSSL